MRVWLACTDACCTRARGALCSRDGKRKSKIPPQNTHKLRRSLVSILVQTCPLGPQQPHRTAHYDTPTWNAASWGRQALWFARVWGCKAKARPKKTCFSSYQATQMVLPAPTKRLFGSYPTLVAHGSHATCCVPTTSSSFAFAKQVYLRLDRGAS